MRIREAIDIVEGKRTTFGLLSATPDNIAKAKAFAIDMWKERAIEQGRAAPADLSYSCKFTSQFAQRLFGGNLEGNWNHQYLRVNDGTILDFNIDASDVKALESPHEHDRIFWNNSEHRKSMKSCLPRVEQWVKRFMTEYE